MPGLRHVRHESPRSHGFVQPAEWTRHAATWTAWPFDDDEWRGHLAGARAEFADLVRAIARHEEVRILTNDEEAENDGRVRLSGVDNITWLRVPLDDVWLRDSGPIFVVRADGAVSFVHWRFNAWGRKFDWRHDDGVPEAIAEALELDHFDVEVVMEGGALETDGRGTVLTTRQCLLHAERNPSFNVTAIEGVLRDNLGCERVVWLERGLEGDHTDGHVDTIARFVNERTIVACVAEDPTDPNQDVLRKNIEVLRAARNVDGEAYDVVEVFLPRERRFLCGERLAMSYVNFYIINGAVLVPQFGDANDVHALEVFCRVFPGRAVTGLPSTELVTGGGSIHCLTQQQPAGPLWRQR